MTLDTSPTFDDPLDGYESMVPGLRHELFEYAEQCDREALELEQQAWALQEEAKQVTEIAKDLQ